MLGFSGQLMTEHEFVPIKDWPISWEWIFPMLVATFSSLDTPSKIGVQRILASNLLFALAAPKPEKLSLKEQAKISQRRRLSLYWT